MSETKHTPGPWYWCDGEDEKDLPYLTSEAGKICEFGNWEAYYPQCGEEPNEADRRLIAAAPELLEALYIVDACGEPKPVELYDGEAEGWEWVHPDGREWHEIGIWEDGPPMHPAARAAIAKAKGEQP